MTTPPHIKDLMERAEKVARALGITSAHALNLIVRQSTEMADELGVSIDMRKIYKREAKRLGIPQGDLSHEQKEAAFIQALLKEKT